MIPLIAIGGVAVFGLGAVAGWHLSQLRAYLRALPIEDLE